MTSTSSEDISPRYILGILVVVSAIFFVSFSKIENVDERSHANWEKAVETAEASIMADLKTIDGHVFLREENRVLHVDGKNTELLILDSGPAWIAVLRNSGGELVQVRYQMSESHKQSMFEAKKYWYERTGVAVINESQLIKRLVSSNGGVGVPERRALLQELGVSVHQD